MRARSMPCAARLVTRIGAGEVGVDDRGEVVLAHPQQQAVLGDAGVGDEHLDRAELAPRRRRTRRRPIRRTVTSHCTPNRPSGGGERVVGDGDLVAERRRSAGAGQADATRAAGDEHDAAHARTAARRRRPNGGRRWPRSCRRRSRRAARDRPASPGRRRGRRRGRAGSMPTRCCRCGASTVDALSIGTPSRWHAASMMRMLAWWGTTRAMSSAVTPAAAIDLVAGVDHDAHGPAEDLLAVHLDVPADLGVEEALGRCRRRRGPSRAAGRARRTASSTTAPDPSANRMAVLRSVQSVMRARRVGADARGPSWRPWRSARGPCTRPYTKPEQAALTSNAPQRRPSSCCDRRARSPARCGRGWWWRGRARRSSAGSTPDMLERLAAGLDREPDGGAADVALVDAGALDDPVVVGVDACCSRSWLVSDLRRQCGAPAGDDGAADARRDGGHVRPSSARRSVGGA